MKLSTRAESRVLPCRLQDLTFALIEGDPEAPAWAVLKERELGALGRRILLQIVGSSHVVRVEEPDHCLAEVLVNRRDIPGSARVMASLELSTCSIPRDMPECPGYTAYRACGQVERLAPELLQERLDAFVRPEGWDLLIHAFPAPAGAAYTVLRYRLSERGFLLETAHTYPEEGGWVRTRSTWRWG